MVHLPKGYEPNAQGEPQDQDKKIWDKYYNGEIELPDVVKELKNYRIAARKIQNLKLQMKISEKKI